jgi:hypothetical protein
MRILTSSILDPWVLGPVGSWYDGLRYLRPAWFAIAKCEVETIWVSFLAVGNGVPSFFEASWDFGEALSVIGQV